MKKELTELKRLKDLTRKLKQIEEEFNAQEALISERIESGEEIDSNYNEHEIALELCYTDIHVHWLNECRNIVDTLTSTTWPTVYGQIRRRLAKEQPPVKRILFMPKE